MKEIFLYINTLKYIIDRYYGKEIIFFNIDDGWYSRYHCRGITPEELVEWVKELTEIKE